MRAECRPIPNLTEKQTQRFLSCVHIDTSTGCWEWTGYCHPEDKYGQFGANYTHWWAHRVSYALFREQPPIDKTLDHACRNRRCVNPWHLEPVSNRENILRGESPSAQQARQTHCKRGHELPPPKANGHRECLICRSANKKAAWADPQKRAAMQAQYHDWWHNRRAS